jgi:hypothetical protein
VVPRMVDGLICRMNSIYALCSMLLYSLAPVLKNWSPKRIVTEWEHQGYPLPGGLPDKK